MRVLKIASVILSCGLVVIFAFWIGLKISDRIVDGAQPVVSENANQNSENIPDPLAYNPPNMDAVPEGPDGDAIKRGYKIVNETNSVLDGYVGNKLSCSSCHAGAGLEQSVSPLVGVTAKYPQYRPREGKIMSIEDRINGCMVRSMNGKEIPENSADMRAIVSYLSYISKGIPTGEPELPWLGQNKMKNVPKPNVNDGDSLYKQSCVACHAADGSGTNTNSGPALWGNNSFNDGAGLSRLTQLAGYIQRNMPAGQAGSLTNQQAVDLAAFILSKDRPEWKGHNKDWPNGGKPNDVIDKKKREQIKKGTINWDDVLKEAQ
ncbi:c-type cytochrome [Heyndrickxia sp. NPDC080065]|uniref:c-type cytochrome n=1 Tax=Heyndrickxia sp. NPDC080065 TaxID=3390568 RepID=UPI003D0257F7